MPRVKTLGVFLWVGLRLEPVLSYTGRSGGSISSVAPLRQRFTPHRVAPALRALPPRRAVAPDLPGAR